MEASPATHLTLTPQANIAILRRQLAKRLVTLLAVPPTLLLAGTVGYRLIEGWPLLDCLYMTVITLTTVGYREVGPLSPAGQVFTILLALSGVFALFYSGTVVIQSILEGELQVLLGSYRVRRILAELKDHVIVCGYGRVGRLVCRELDAAGQPFVVIDRNLEVLRDVTFQHGIPLEGDATSEDVLREAGLERARALVASLASDADNLYITMTARLMNPALRIVARADDERAERKLTRAGADRVVAPYRLGGLRIAHAILRPSVVEFLDLAVGGRDIELAVEEIELRDDSTLVGRTLRDSGLRDAYDIIVIALRRGEFMHVNPSPETVFQPGDTIIVTGHREKLDRFIRDHGRRGNGVRRSAR